MITHNHAWGESWDIYRDKSVWVVGFKGYKGGASSVHRHDRMINFFVLTAGEMALREHGRLVPMYLAAGRTATIKAGVYHQLDFTADAEGIETYYAMPGHEIDAADITKLTPPRAPDGAAVPA